MDTYNSKIALASWIQKPTTAKLRLLLAYKYLQLQKLRLLLAYKYLQLQKLRLLLAYKYLQLQNCACFLDTNTYNCKIALASWIQILTTAKLRLLLGYKNLQLQNCACFLDTNTYNCKSRKKNPQKLTQLSSRSHPRHLMGKRIALKDITIDTTSDSQVNGNFQNRWSPASLTFNNFFYLFLYLYIT